MTALRPRRHGADAIDSFFARFDAVHGTRTDTAPVIAALAGVPHPVRGDYATPLANLRAGGYRLLGADVPEFSTGPRTVANRRQLAYADTAALLDALERGVVLQRERPDLLTATWDLGLDGVRDEIDRGRLSVVSLHLLACGQEVVFDTRHATSLVVQLEGHSEWGAAGRRAGPGDCRVPAAGWSTCRPVSDGALLVLAYRHPTADSVRAALLDGFLRRLAADGEQERHHLVLPARKAGWVRDRLAAYLAELYDADDPDAIDLAAHTGHADLVTVHPPIPATGEVSVAATGG